MSHTSAVSIPARHEATARRSRAVLVAGAALILLVAPFSTSGAQDDEAPRHDRRDADLRTDDAGAERMRWNVRAAWPVKWSGPAFDAGSDAIAIESLELAHEGIEVAKW